MPILNLRFDKVDAKDASGKAVSLPPQIGLQNVGPVLPVTLQPFQGVAGKSAQGLALIDTGASQTCIDSAIAQEIELPVVDTGRMNSATQRNATVPIFAARLVMIHQFGNIDASRAVGANLQPHNIVALIGRDLLSTCIMVYNGLDGTVSLSR